MNNKTTIKNICKKKNKKIKAMYSPAYTSNKLLVRVLKPLSYNVFQEQRKLWFCQTLVWRVRDI
jgi:hypothetical protein